MVDVEDEVLDEEASERTPASTTGRDRDLQGIAFEARWDVWYIVSYCQLNSDTVRLLEVRVFAGCPDKVATFIHTLHTYGRHWWC